MAKVPALLTFFLLGVKQVEAEFSPPSLALLWQLSHPWQVVVPRALPSDLSSQDGSVPFFNPSLVLCLCFDPGLPCEFQAGTYTIGSRSKCWPPVGGELEQSFPPPACLMDAVIIPSLSPPSSPLSPLSLPSAILGIYSRAFHPPIVLGLVLCGGWDQLHLLHSQVLIITTQLSGSCLPF